MKKGETKPNSKWGHILDRFLALGMGESFTVKGDEIFANRLRAIIRVSRRTAQWKATVTRSGSEWRVTKAGRWS